ncbi:MAG: phosphate/phosphite/phosphonate ABC transporter substrate-binding protein [Desulfobacterales bacterium]|nr:phosphate/phosphite/phosphonate ABC transporter substrate-binding protein [Desulfobacterales bacterium]
MLKRSFLLTLLVLFLGVSISHAEVNLLFGLYASDKPTALKSMFDPILKELESNASAKLGEPVKIKIKFSKTYELGVKDFVKGKVDFVRFGPASYIEAKKASPGVTILAMEAKKGKKTFNGIICVAKDSKIQSVEDLKGKKFAFGNKKSTIGRYLSQLYLANHGVKASDLAKSEYLKNHQSVAIAVARGGFDAGALKESTFKKMVKKGADLRAIASFPNVTKPWIARAGLREDVKMALSESLLEIKDPAVLKKLKKDGFLPGDDDDYAVIRESIDNNDLFFK